MKLDLGGENSKEGWHTVNFLDKSPDIIWNLNNSPYPWEDNSIDEIYMRMTLEHLDKPMEVLNECYRILKTEGKLKIIVPHGFTCHYKPCHLHNFIPKWFSEYVWLYNFNWKIIKLTTVRGRFLKWQKRSINLILIKKVI